jgi:hypothetical protein
MKTAEKGQDGPEGFFVVPVKVTVKAFNEEEARSTVMRALDMNTDVQNVVTSPVRPAADSDMDGFDHLFEG